MGQAGALPDHGCAQRVPRGGPLSFCWPLVSKRRQAAPPRLRMLVCRQPLHRLPGLSSPWVCTDGAGRPNSRPQPLLQGCGEQTGLDSELGVGGGGKVSPILLSAATIPAPRSPSRLLLSPRARMYTHTRTHTCTHPSLKRPALQSLPLPFRTIQKVLFKPDFKENDI